MDPNASSARNLPTASNGSLRLTFSASRRNLSEWLQGQLGPELNILRPLGKSELANTFLARDAQLARLVVLKVLSPDLAADSSPRARFERAARAAAAIHHPNVVTIYRFGWLADEVPYLVLRYIKGVTLEERLAAEGAFTISEAKRIVAELADALGSLHIQGFVHRNLRPDSILYEEETGRAVLSDLPLVGLLPSHAGADPRITGTGEVLVSPEFASPEQLRGEDASEASDIYSLAVLGYHLVAGEGPFEQEAPKALAAVHLGSLPRPLRSLRPDADEPFATLLQRCLSKDAARRPRAFFLAEVLRCELLASTVGKRDVVAADRLKRRLSAIWFADLVGYVRLSVQNEARALEIIGLFQRIARDVIERSGGTVVKFLGDGVFAQFDSTEVALRAALALREEFGAADLDLELCGALRIGMHVGDVAVGADGDVYGDGVNIAARLTAEASPSSVLVSLDVWRQLRRRGEFTFAYRGEAQLAGIEEPLPVYEASPSE